MAGLGGRQGPATTRGGNRLNGELSYRKGARLGSPPLFLVVSQQQHQPALPERREKAPVPLSVKRGVIDSSH